MISTGDRYRCSEALRHDPGRSGNCRWCGKRCDTPALRPDRYPASDTSDAYRYFFDPDFGSDRMDVY